VAALAALLATVFAGRARAGGEREVELDCVIVPSQVAEVSSGALQGTCAAILVERGELVYEGQPVAALDTRLEEASVRAAEAHVRQRAALEATRAVRDYAVRVRDRARRLHAESILSAQDLDDAESRAEVAMQRYNIETESLEQWRREADRALVALEQRTIVSPLTGVVVERITSAGEFAGQARLMRIATLDPLHVEVVVPVEHYGRILRGMTAEVRPAERPGGRYRALVSVVDRVLDPASATFGVRLVLANPGNRLPGGMRGKVRFKLPPPRGERE
jgi:RND family efflux transporter MFP subunit